MVDRRMGRRALASKRGGLNDSGATAIEYAVLAALIAVVIYGAVAALGIKVLGLYTSVINVIP